MRSSSTRPPSTEGSGPASEAPQVPEVLIEASGLTRRQLLRRGVAAGLAVGAAGVLVDAPAAGAAQPTKSPRLRDGLANPTGIHPFRVKVPNKQLAALRRHVAATRWPSRELVADRSQGVQLATAQALARFWTTRYDWRRFERDLEPRLATGTGDLAHLAGWAAKLAGATCRLAGLLHLASHLRDGWAHPIGADAFAGALRLGGNQNRLRLPPKAAPAAGRLEGADAPMNQSCEALLAARPLHSPEAARQPAPWGGDGEAVDHAVTVDQLVPARPAPRLFDHLDVPLAVLAQHLVNTRAGSWEPAPLEFLATCLWAR